MQCLKVFRKLFDPIFVLTQTEKSLKKLLVSQEEKEGLDLMIIFLEKITNYLSSEKSSITELPIFYHGLLLHLNHYENNENIGYIAKEMKLEFLRVLFFIHFF